MNSTAKLAFSFLVLVSCSTSEDGPDRLLGKLPINGIQNVYFMLYQEDEFDSATALHYSIVDSAGNLIQGERFLIGTGDYHEDVRDFCAGCHDSIIYLSFLDPNYVYAIRDLKTGENSLNGWQQEDFTTSDRLISRLRVYNKSLKNMWTEQ